MAARRELHYYMDYHYILLLIALTLPFVGLSWFVFTNTNILAGRILFAALFVCLTPIALYLLTILLFSRLFPWPTIEIDETGITYRAPYAPWRKIVVPWADVTHMGFYRWGGGTGAAYRPVTSHTMFAVYTKHPARYTSELRQRLSTWWSPGLGGASIVIALERLNLDSFESYKAFLDAIKTAFAPEIAEYKIAVSLHS